MTEQEYDALSEKMKNDKEFLEKVKACKSEHQIYETYKEAGYTDVGFEEFSEAFKGVSRILDTINDLKAEKEGKTATATAQLTDEQLDSVVGGFDLFKFFVGITDFIPIIGPMVSDTIKAVKAFTDGDIRGGLKDLFNGVAVTTISALSGGFGAAKGINGLIGAAAGKSYGHFISGESGGIGNLIDAFNS